MYGSERSEGVKEEGSCGKEIVPHGYLPGQVLGEGTYSKVIQAYSKRLKKSVALKIIDKEKIPTLMQQKFLPQELSIILQVKHRNIVIYLEALDQRKQVGFQRSPFNSNG